MKFFLYKYTNTYEKDDTWKSKPKPKPKPNPLSSPLDRTPGSSTPACYFSARVDTVKTLLLLCGVERIRSGRMCCCCCVVLIGYEHGAVGCVVLPDVRHTNTSTGSRDLTQDAAVVVRRWSTNTWRSDVLLLPVRLGCTLLSPAVRDLTEVWTYFQVRNFVLIRKR
jgi:hypothetical protein